MNETTGTKTSNHRKVSLSDVAQYAGVSTATVSRVLNRDGGSSRVSNDTCTRVLEAVEKLRYRPNLLARNFSRQKTNTIGLVVSDIVDPHVATVIAGVERATRPAGYTYILSNAANSMEGQKRCVELFSQKQVDGVLLHGFEGDLEDVGVSVFVEEGTPIVLIGRISPDNRIPSVNLDNIKGGRMAVEYLAGLGHQRIVYMPGRRYESDPRYQGYQQAMQAAGLFAEPPVLTQNYGYWAADGYSAMKRFMSMGRLPTAVFCYSDLMASGVLKAIHEAGLSIPGDISVVGFDDIEASQYYHPALTTVVQPGFQMGYQAAGMLLQMLSDESKLTERKIVFKPSLVIRESAGPCQRTAMVK